jgi:formiminoglutamase
MTSPKDLSIFFQPIALDLLNALNAENNTFRTKIAIHTTDNFPDLSGADLAIMGVLDDRCAIENEGCATAPDYIRQQFYKLYCHSKKINIVDLGNINKGDSIADTHYAVTNVISQLLTHNIIPIILGGGQDITYANYSAYQKLEKTINIVTVDPSFDLGEFQSLISSKTYLSKIILHQPNYLFNYSNIGYQTYFVDPYTLELMNKLFFDVYRLGMVKEDIRETEPIIRNADMLSIDMAVVKKSDAPGSAVNGPNGLSGEDICQICRYAGMSDKLTSFGIYELNPYFDRMNQTSALAAQMIWCFIDGYYQRKKDFPFADQNDYIKYRVSIKNVKDELVFYKSKKTDRWWMDIPFASDGKNKFERHHIVPCSYIDYQTACNEEMPDKWWQNFQKLSL